MHLVRFRGPDEAGPVVIGWLWGRSGRPEAHRVNQVAAFRRNLAPIGRGQLDIVQKRGASSGSIASMPDDFIVAVATLWRHLPVDGNPTATNPETNNKQTTTATTSYFFVSVPIAQQSGHSRNY